MVTWKDGFLACEFCNRSLNQSLYQNLDSSVGQLELFHNHGYRAHRVYIIRLRVVIVGVSFG